MENSKNINFSNIEQFIKAVDVNNETSFNYYFYRNEYISSFLATGDLNYFCKQSKKILKEINFQELLLDIQATLILHDSIKSLIDPTITKMYQSDYWNDLYKDMPSTSNGYEDFVLQYQKNFDDLIHGKLISSGQIIYIFLTQTMEYVNNLLNDEEGSKESIDEYNNAMKIPSVLLLEKYNITKQKRKSLFRKQ